MLKLFALEHFMLVYSTSDIIGILRIIVGIMDHM